MPPFEEEPQSRVVDAVLWAFNRVDGYGRLLLDAPVAVKVRWLDKYREVLDAHGQTVSTDTQVIAGFAIPTQSILWRGLLSDLPPPPNRKPSGDLRQVITSNSTPDIKGRFSRNECSLMRFTDELPQLA